MVAITDASGTLTSQQRYLPFGGLRSNVTSPNSPSTDFGYTGQRNLDEDIGLMDYRARFYSPYLNRFIQPDTIVPNPSNPQAYNRYSYVVNSPINLNDPTGHAYCDFLDNNNAEDCNGGLANSQSSSVIWKKKDKEKNEDIPPCGYHLCSDTNLYELGWQNFGQAWNIFSNPNASAGQRFFSYWYMSSWGLAHAALVVGGGLYACAGFVTCASALGFGANNANATCGGDMCASEFETVYRVWGGKSPPFGQSWTNIDPRTISNFRNFAGLPDSNTGQFLSIGRLINNAGVTLRNALPLDGNVGGLSEVLIPNAAKQVIINQIIKLIPPY